MAPIPNPTNAHHRGLALLESEAIARALFSPRRHVGLGRQVLSLDLSVPMNLGLALLYHNHYP